LAIKLCDKVVAQTDEQKEILRTDHNRDCEVIPNGYTSADLEEVPSFDKRKFVLWVGRMNQKQKQPHIFLDIAGELPNVEFRMIGPPANNEESYYKQIKERAKKLHNVSFKGFVPHNEIHEHYQEAAALINTSKYEGFPNTFLEAWRYKVPVLSLHYSIGNEFHEKGGICSGSTQELVKDTLNVWQHAEVQKQLGYQGWQYFNENFLIEEVAERYSDAIIRMCS
jgi:glycosyltransferase involved in cell wall biosynthesis